MFDVLSFDSKKVEISLNASGETIVKKQTTQKEYINITLARQHLLKHQPVLDFAMIQNFSISVAGVSDWNQELGILSTFFCNGDNLEGILKNSFGKDRVDWIEILKKIFEIFKSSGFLWGDFAPRNMILDWSQKTLWLVDFERDLQLKDGPIEQEVFNRYVCNYSREEFSCFLSKEEQFSVFREFLRENCTRLVPTDQIASKRKKGLLKNLFGDKNCYSIAELYQTEDVMVFVATPFYVNEVLFFPMDSLDQIGSKGGTNEYVNAVMAIRNLREPARFSELKKRAEAF